MRQPDHSTALVHARNAALILAGVLGLYATALTYGFVWDDYHFAGSYRTGEVLRRFWGTWDPQAIESPFYRPFVIASYAADHALWGMNPAGYHLTNLLVHAACAVAVYALLCSYGMLAAASCAGALVFAWRPSNAIAATWISGRTDSLATLFCLLSAVALAKRSKGGAIVGCVAFAFALGCKEVAVTLPGVLLVGALLSRRSESRVARPRALAAVFVMLVAYLLLRVAMFGGMGGRGDHLVLLQKPRQSAERLVRHVAWSALPGSAFLYAEELGNAPIWFDEPAEPQHRLAVALYSVMLLGGLFCTWRRTWRGAAYSLAWIVLPCIPSLGVPGLRNLYMSTVGGAMLTAHVLSAVRTRRGRALCCVAWVAVGMASADLASRYRDVLAPQSGFVVAHDLEAAIYWWDRLAPEAREALANRLREHGPLLEKMQQQAEQWVVEEPAAAKPHLVLGMILAYRAIRAAGPDAGTLRADAARSLRTFLRLAPEHATAERVRALLEVMETPKRALPKSGR